MIAVLAVLLAVMVLVVWKGAGRNRIDEDGHLTPLDYFDQPIPVNRAARRARD